MYYYISPYPKEHTSFITIQGAGGWIAALPAAEKNQINNLASILTPTDLQYFSIIKKEHVTLLCNMLFSLLLYMAMPECLQILQYARTLFPIPLKTARIIVVRES